MTAPATPTAPETTTAAVPPPPAANWRPRPRDPFGGAGPFTVDRRETENGEPVLGLALHILARGPGVKGLHARRDELEARMRQAVEDEARRLPGYGRYSRLCSQSLSARRAEERARLQIRTLELEKETAAAELPDDLAGRLVRLDEQIAAAAAAADRAAKEHAALDPLVQVARAEVQRAAPALRRQVCQTARDGERGGVAALLEEALALASPLLSEASLHFVAVDAIIGEGEAEQIISALLDRAETGAAAEVANGRK